MVFNRFWRADPARARTSGGTGLGLSISLEDTHLHGGWLQAWGRPGEGAQFRLTLPRRAGGALRHSPLPLVPTDAAEPLRSPGRAREPTRGSAASPSGASLAALLVAALAGCVSLPEQRAGGRDRPPGPRPRTAAAPSIDPLPPAAGRLDGADRPGLPRRDDGDPDPDQRRRGSTSPRTPQAAWDPDQSTVIYADALSPSADPAHGVSVRLTAAERLDARGAWQGGRPGRVDPRPARWCSRTASTGSPTRRTPWSCPSPGSSSASAQVSLYFFDRTGQILVPESVFVPRGQQLASTLTTGLLAGPAGEPDRVTRTFIPDGLSLGLSVPISADGVAEIDARPVTPARAAPPPARLMLAQLAWTLRQDSSDRGAAGEHRRARRWRCRATSTPTASTAARSTARPATRPARCCTGSTARGGWSPADPTSSPASTGPLGARDYGLAVAGGRPRRRERPRASAATARPCCARPCATTGRPRCEEVVTGATDLLTPALGLRRPAVARRPDPVRRPGARISTWPAVRELEVPGISGERRPRLPGLARRHPAGGGRARSRRGPAGDGRVLSDRPGPGAARGARHRVDAADGGPAAAARPGVVDHRPRCRLLSRVRRRPRVEVRTVAVDGAPSGSSIAGDAP